MDSRSRDALLAVLALAGLLVVGSATVGASVFLGALPVTVGVVGAVVVEAAFLRYPDRALAVWDRPGVAAGAAVAVVVLGVAAAGYGTAWLLGALAWGLAAYLVILAAVVVLAENEPT